MKRFCFLTIFSLCFICTNVWPLAPSDGSKQETKKELQQEVTVTLKLIQVYVTDKKGNPVIDLEKEDFALKDSGKIKKITDFEKHILTASVEKPDLYKDETFVMPQPGISRKFFLLFDFAFNNLGGINMAKQAAFHLLDTYIHPTDEVGIITYSTTGGLSLHEYLTNDHAAIRTLISDFGLKEILGRAGMLLNAQESQYRRGGEFSVPDGIRSGAAAQWLEASSRSARENLMKSGGMMEYRLQARHFSSTVKDMAKALRYIPGYKHIILFSTGIPNWLMYSTDVQAAPKLNQVNIAGSDMSDLRRRYEEMARELASANSPVYAVNVDGMYTEFMDRREGATADRLSVFERQQPSTGLTDKQHWRGITSLFNLANDTGGKYFDNTNSPEKVAEEIQRITGSYYVLGYPINENWDGKFHKINVEVKGKGYNIHAQKGYYNPKPFNKYSDLEKKIHLIDLVLTAKPHFGRTSSFPMITLPNEIGNRTKSVMLFRISQEALAEVAQDETEIVFLTFDKKQNVIGFMGMNVDNPEMFRKGAFIYTVQALYPGEFDCRVIVRNTKTGQAAVANSHIVVPKTPEKGLRLFPPLILAQEKEAEYINAGVDKENGEVAEQEELLEIYPFETSQYSPVVGPFQKNTSHILILMRCSVFNIPEAEVKLSARLVHQPTRKKVPLEITFDNKLRDEQGSGVIFPMDLKTADLQPGKYYLYIFAEEINSGHRSTVNTSFEIEQE